MPKLVKPKTIHTKRFVNLMKEMRGVAQHIGLTVSSKGPPHIMILNGRNITEHSKITAHSIVERYFSGQTVLVLPGEDAETVTQAKIETALKTMIFEAFSEQSLQISFLGIEIIKIKATSQPSHEIDTESIQEIKTAL